MNHYEIKHIMLLAVVILCPLLAASQPWFEDDIFPLLLGGVDANINEFPFMASILDDDEFLCSASILTSKYILTAAHCTYGQAVNYLVRVGSSYRDKGGILHEIKRKVMHPKFNMETLDYDIGIIEVKKPIEFNENTQPATLATAVPMEGESAELLGYGLSGFDIFPDQLQLGKSHVMNNAKCNKAVEEMVITPRMICFSKPSVSVYFGDSGGPALINGKIVGVTSFGNGINPTASPSVYANVLNNEIRKFIDNETAN